jgi:hypothetical protein
MPIKDSQVIQFCMHGSVYWWKGSFKRGFWDLIHIYDKKGYLTMPSVGIL